MIRLAIKDDDIKLLLCNKGVYNHLADLCENWNVVVNICNVKNGPHSPKNAVNRQTMLLDIFD